MSANMKPWRPFRFPPLKTAQGEQAFDLADVQQAVSEGFREGIEKGYQEGLDQGQQAGQSEGFNVGRAEGLRQGQEEGRRDGRHEFELAVRPLEAIQAAFREHVDAYEARRRQELLELVRKVARQVIRCELTLNPAQLLTLVEEALTAMPASGEDEIEVRLNPEEFARIRDVAPERAQRWRLVPDPRLELGECRVLTPQAEADIGCQQRLDSCMDALAQHLTVEPS